MFLPTKFVLALILLALGTLFVYSWTNENCYTDESGQLRCEWVFKRNPMTEAIKCAYYRCTEGCEEAIKKVNSQIFDCSEFCKYEEWGIDEKICGGEAKSYPVEVSMTQDTFLKQFKPFDSMATDPDCKKKETRHGRHENIIIDESKIVDENCPTASTRGIVQGRRCEIQIGEYYIWHEISYGLIGNRAYDSTIICGRAPEEIDNGDEPDVGVTPEPPLE